MAWYAPASLRVGLLCVVVLRAPLASQRRGVDVERVLFFQRGMAMQFQWWLLALVLWLKRAALTR